VSDQIILTLAEAAAYLKTGVKSVRRLVRVGALPARKINRKGELRFHRDALDRYVLGQKPAAS
jgi:excisionase family DNA binding protein